MNKKIVLLDTLINTDMKTSLVFTMNFIDQLFGITFDGILAEKARLVVLIKGIKYTVADITLDTDYSTHMKLVFHLFNIINGLEINTDWNTSMLVALNLWNVQNGLEIKRDVATNKVSFALTVAGNKA